METKNIVILVLPIIVPIFASGLNTWINIKIKFAKDATQAIRETKQIFIFILKGFLILGCLFLLIKELLSTSPLDRFSVLIIVFNSLFLWNVFIQYQINKIWNSFLSFAEAVVVKFYKQ
tara:strand:+ start:110 stop:466 length:357 start_codon:yes stop_codon:yes gene_type:complete